MAVKIGIVDGSPVFARGLDRLLADAGYTVVATAGKLGHGALWGADVLLIERELLDLNLCRKLLAQIPWMAIIITVRDVDRAALRSEWATTLSRSASEAEVVEAVRHASGGRPLEYRERTGSLPVPGDGEGDAPLSPREMEVLHFIAQGLTHHQVARRLGISHHTVGTYVRRIRKKLGVDNKAELTRIAVSRQMGSGSGISLLDS